MKENKLQLIFQFIREIHKIIKLKFWILVVFGVLNSFFQAVGVVLIIPLLETYHSGSKTSLLAKTLVSLGWNGSLEWILVLYFIILFLYGIFKSLYTYESSRQVAIFSMNFTKSALRKIVLSPWSFFNHHSPSKLTVLFHAETMNIRMLTVSTFRIIQTILLILIQLVLSFWLSWQITFATFLALGMIYIVQKRIVSKNFKLGTKRVLLSESIQKYLTETFKAVKLIKLHHHEENRLIAYENTQDELYSNDEKLAKNEGLSDFYFISTGALVIVTIIYLSIHFNYLKISGLLVLLVLLFKVIGHLQSLIKAIGQYLNFLPSFQLFQETLEDTGTNSTIAKSSTLLKIDTIELKNISFSYGEKKVLNGKSHLFEKGKIYLFFGPSGKGKTTTLDLITGLIKPNDGEFLINGNKIDSHSILQTNISYVLQETILFQGSIEENISFGDNYTTQEINNAIQLAGLEDCISNLPHGIKTVIDENATMLSGGEKQRISIARALIRNSDILLLDEITSSLDARNEAHIMETISSIKKDKIILIVGHREKLKDWADEVVVY